MTLTARLAYLSQGNSRPILNLQFKDGKMPLRIELTPGQLKNLVMDGARMALGDVR